MNELIAKTFIGIGFIGKTTMIFKTILVNYNKSAIMSIGTFLIKNISFHLAFSWTVQKIKLYVFNEMSVFIESTFIFDHFPKIQEFTLSIVVDSYYRFYLRSIYRGHNEWIKRVQRTTANYSSFVCCVRSFIVHSMNDN